MLIVGLTGGIACGKSSVATQLRRDGVPVVDCDELAKRTTEKGGWGYRRVVAAFGSSILNPDGEAPDGVGRLGAHPLAQHTPASRVCTSCCRLTPYLTPCCCCCCLQPSRQHRPGSAWPPGV
jgi:hypothetical protein